jgi:hypothetical protein
MPNKKRLLRLARVFDHHGTVPPRPTKDMLLQGLADAGTSFERGKLAYLAVTSKVESPVRDRFAWELHRRLEDRSLLGSTNQLSCRAVR